MPNNQWTVITTQQISVGQPTIWDGGTTTWDGGGTVWDALPHVDQTWTTIQSADGQGNGNGNGNS